MPNHDLNTVEPFKTAQSQEVPVRTPNEVMPVQPAEEDGGSSHWPPGVSSASMLSGDPAIAVTAAIESLRDNAANKSIDFSDIVLIQESLREHKAKQMKEIAEHINKLRSISNGYAEEMEEMTEISAKASASIREATADARKTIKRAQNIAVFQVGLFGTLGAWFAIFTIKAIWYSFVWVYNW